MDNTEATSRDFEQNNMLAEVLNRMTDGFVALDENWCYTFMNKKAGEIVGRNPREMKGKNMWDEFPFLKEEPLDLHDAYLKAMQEQKSISIDKYYAPFDKWFATQIYPSAKGITIYFRDISERKITADVIHIINKQYEALINSTSDLLWSINNDYRLITANKVFVKGLKENGGFEIKPGDNVLSPAYFADEYVKYWKNIYKEALSGKKVLKEVFTPQANSTEFLWFELKVDPIFIENKIKGAACVMRDITKRKMTEQKIKESEEKYRSLVEQASDGIAITDQQGNFLEVNESYCRLLGYSADEFIGMTLLDIIPEEDIINKPPLLNELLEGKNIINERSIKRKDGSIFTAEINSKMAANGSLIGFLRDISKRKQVEENLIEKENQLRIFIENSPVPLVMLDKDMRYLEVSNRWLQDYSLDKKNIIGKCQYDVFPEISENWKAVHCRCLNGVSEKKEEDLFIRHDGSEEWVRWEVHPWYNMADVVGGLIIFTEIISERKNAEKRLAESENRLRSILESEPECVKILTAKGEIEDMNPAGLAMIEADHLEIVKGKSVLGIIDEKYRKGFTDLTKKVFEGESGSLTFEITGLKGTKRWLETHAVSLKNNEGKIISLLGVTRDITERKKAEEKVIQLNKELEQRVKERTAALEAANKELEEINDLFVGREARIIELKEELEILKIKN